MNDDMGRVEDVNNFSERYWNPDHSLGYFKNIFVTDTDCNLQAQFGDKIIEVTLHHNSILILHRDELGFPYRVCPICGKLQSNIAYGDK